jgi:mono/diheme cytochrome c family protein
MLRRKYLESIAMAAEYVHGARFAGHGLRDRQEIIRDHTARCSLRRMNPMTRRIRWWLAAGVLVVLTVAVAGMLYRGALNVAADDPHWSMTARLLESVRERSIVARARGIAAPDLGNGDMIESGASHYDSMCAGCHLAPGIERTDLRAGLNPMPPDLVRHGGERAPAQKFWIIKHGVKMTGMPAWGRTHDDGSIWAIVAFLEQLPKLDAVRYQALVSGGGHHDDHEAHADDGADHDHDTHHDQVAHGGHGDNHGDDVATHSPVSRSPP